MLYVLTKLTMTCDIIAYYCHVAKNEVSSYSQLNKLSFNFKKEKRKIDQF